MGCAASKTVGDLVRDAARRDDLEELKELLQSHEGKDAESLRDVINSTDSRGRTALMLAAKRGHAEVGGLLLQRGADPNIATYSLRAPLHVAAYRNDPAFLHILMAHGARLGLENGGGQAALDVALDISNHDFVKECFSYCAFAGEMLVEPPRGRFVARYVVLQEHKRPGALQGPRRWLEMTVITDASSTSIAARAKIYSAGSSTIVSQPGSDGPALQITVGEEDAEGFKVHRSGSGAQEQRHILVMSADRGEGGAIRN